MINPRIRDLYKIIPAFTAVGILVAFIACSAQQNTKTAETVLPIAEKIACAIAQSEKDDTAIAIACDIAPKIMPSVLPALTIHRDSLDAGTKKMGAGPCVTIDGGK
jgi:hypothetical protein